MQPDRVIYIESDNRPPTHPPPTRIVLHDLHCFGFTHYQAVTSTIQTIVATSLRTDNIQSLHLL